VSKGATSAKADDDDWEEEISAPTPSVEKGGKGKDGTAGGNAQIRQNAGKAAGKNQAHTAKGTGKDQAQTQKGGGKIQAAATSSSSDASATDLELAKQADAMAKKALQKIPEEKRAGKLQDLRKLCLKKLKAARKDPASGESGKEASSTNIAGKSKLTMAAKKRQQQMGRDAWEEDERPKKKARSNDQAHGNSGQKIKGTDPEGRKYDFMTVVVNMANVGASYGKKVLHKQKSFFDWEGVRRCVRFLKCERKLKVIGVLHENYRATDNNQMPQVSMPPDIVKMCHSVEETPRLTGTCHSSADDEMTIKCAYRRNCRFLDNDNYRDWTQQMRDVKIRTWLSKCQDLLQMRYYFDSGLGSFDVLEGNIPEHLLAKGKNDVDKKTLWTASRTG